MKLVIKLFLTLLLTGSIFIFSACKKDTNGSGTEDEKGYITGKVTDPSGKPLAGASVNANYNVGAGSGSGAESATTDANGNYKIPVPLENFNYYMTGSVTKSLNGINYTIPLEPQNLDYIPGGSGGSCDFKWKLTGRQAAIQGQPSIHYYGGGITVSEFNFSTCDGGVECNTLSYTDLPNIRLKLEPIDNLIDGSTGRTIEANIQSDLPGLVNGLPDVPIGRYKVTATWNNGDARPIYLKDVGTDYYQSTFVDHTPSITLDFTPSNTSGVSTYWMKINVSDNTAK